MMLTPLCWHQYPNARADEVINLAMTAAGFTRRAQAPLFTEVDVTIRVKMRSESLRPPVRAHYGPHMARPYPSRGAVIVICIVGSGTFSALHRRAAAGRLVGHPSFREPEMHGV